MFRAPGAAGLPPVSVMLADIPATDQQIARYLGIAVSTLKTYRRTGNAPRAVQLALFWETKWGRSAADTEAANCAAVHVAQARALQEHTRRISGIVWRLELELSKDPATRSANLPFFATG